MLSPEKRRRNQESLGTLLKEARHRRGFTQKELADTLGLEYYTMISQMELGYISIPPTLWVPIGIALKLPLSEWVASCLSEVQPEVYNALFEDAPISAVSFALDRLKHEQQGSKENGEEHVPVP